MNQALYMESGLLLRHSSSGQIILNQQVESLNRRGIDGLVFSETLHLQPRDHNGPPTSQQSWC